MDENTSKKSVNPSSLVDLKAELFRKQEEFKTQKLQKATFIKSRVTEKKPNIWSKKNAGVLQRAERDLEAKAEEENSLEKSRKALAAKAKLYEKMTQGNEIPEEDGSKIFLVDFQKKAIDTIIEKRDEERKAGANSRSDESCNDVMTEDIPANPGEEWVEFTDSLGRVRTCMRKDLAELQRRDKDLNVNRKPADVVEKPDLMSEDMRRELERERWERETEEELDKPTGPIHYADVQHREVRDHGVGFYQFSQEEEQRQAEMERLANLRQQTVDQRSKREMIKEKRKAMLESRLAKVKQRKLGREGGGVFSQVALQTDSKTEEKPETSKEQKVDQDKDVEAKVESVLQAVRKAESRTAAVREWDIGKTEYLNLQWENRKQKLEDDRNPEFAPPTALYSMETANQNKPNVRGRRRFPVGGQRSQEPPQVKILTREEYEAQCRNTSTASSTASSDSTVKTEPVIQNLCDIPLPECQPSKVKQEPVFCHSGVKHDNFTPEFSQDSNFAQAVSVEQVMLPGCSMPLFASSVFNTTVPPPGFDITVPPPEFDTTVPPPGFDTTVPPPAFVGAVPPSGFDPHQPLPSPEPVPPAQAHVNPTVQPPFAPVPSVHCQPVSHHHSIPQGSTTQPVSASNSQEPVVVPKLHIMDTRYIKNKEAPVLATLTPAGQVGIAEVVTSNTGAAPPVVSNPVISGQPVKYMTQEK
ncbi:coiled-coil domain-containing protein 174-like [Liolophura sinensis]|uniref:coiled-coil domain-containing protein 174-like n=1 Tax=Liolophura sinensis TaxID=3198878 RepID=UPI0031593401